MKNISLRRFRAEIVDLREPTEVSRRDREGNIQLLGFWTPYLPSHDGAVELSSPGGNDADEALGATVRVPGEGSSIETSFIAPKAIKTPEEAREATRSAVQSTRAFPKEAQLGRRRKS